MPLSPSTLRNDFPIYAHRPELVYLDSAATAQKPKSVLKAMRTYYEHSCANVSRGLYPMAETTTTAVAAARERVARFIGSNTDCTIFVASATQGINLVATGLREQIKSGENIVVTAAEHHSNFLPWKELAQKTQAEFRVAPFDTAGLLTVNTLLPSLDSHTRILALTAVSNVFGLINPIPDIIQAVRTHFPQVLILIDACQAVGHIPISLQSWDADFLVFSGHKVFGPTGIGILAGKKQSLERLGAVNVGGGTVLDPLSSPVEYKPLPDALEGGTPHIAGIIGLGAAIEYIEHLGVNTIHIHEETLIRELVGRLETVFGDRVTLLGDRIQSRAGILAFTLKNIHPHDLAHLLGENNICIRAGEHCARPLHQSLQLSASARVSVSIYTTKEDIERLITGIEQAVDTMKA